VILDVLDILVHGIGGPAIPLVPLQALLGWKHVDELVEVSAEESPSELQVLQQLVGVVLGEYQDPPDIGIYAIREGEIDDPVLAAEIEAGLRGMAGEVEQAFSPSTSKDHRDGALSRPE
jgi:hypothetical protein